MKEKLGSNSVFKGLEFNFANILSLGGEDLNRDGLIKTPERVAKSMQFLLKGYEEDPDEIIQKALFNVMKDRTTVVIAHRLSTIQHADEIIVLKKGEIVERGTHAKLISLDGVYTRLQHLQAFD